VQLAHHNPFRPVDHECSERGHDRQFAEIHFLLDGVLEPLLTVDVFEHIEPQLGLEWGSVRHVPLDALFHRVLGLSQRVTQELETVLPVHVGNREEIPKDPLQGDVLAVAFLLGNQKALKRLGLDVQEMRHGHAALALGERNDRLAILHGLGYSAQRAPA
jgi:hypothetical protein